jgi:hypothetical protein
MGAAHASFTPPCCRRCSPAARVRLAPHLPWCSIVCISGHAMLVSYTEPCPSISVIIQQYDITQLVPPLHDHCKGNDPSPVVVVQAHQAPMR